MNRCALTCAALSALLSSVSVSAEAASGIDSNGNQMSDLYEQLYPGLDPNADNDRDGQPNRQEAVSGTNPLDGRSRLDFGAVSQNAAVISAQFQTERGKQYQIQMTGDLAAAWANEGQPLMGTGGTMVGACPNSGQRVFLRLQVQDVDSDGDGASDWEEYTAGTDPLLSDTDDDGISDAEALGRRLALTSAVEIIASDATASEGGQTGEFTLVRHGSLNPITVNLNWSGTATPLTDYAAVPTSVFLGLGVNTATIRITALADAVSEAVPETVIATLVAGGGYAVGSLDSATVSVGENRDGLLGQYFETQETPYLAPPATNANFNPAQMELSRVDQTVDFSWGNGPPAPTIDTSDWSIRWTGSVIPSVSGPCTFYVQFDRGAVLYVDGQRLVNQWSATQNEAVASPEFSGTVTLTAGKPASIQLDYRESTTSPTRSEVRLSWLPPGGTKQIIPKSALTPDAPAPVLASPAFAVAFVGGPFSYQIAATNSPSGYAASGLPSGLTVNAATGLISGSPAAAAGLYFPVITASNAGGTGSTTMTLLVIDSGGGLTRDVWTGVTGRLADLPLHTAPTTTTLVTSLATPANAGDDFGDRLRGYLTAPLTGNYTFFASSDENAEVWISSSEEPGQTLKRSWVTNGGGIAPDTWNALATQRSLSMKLQAGKKYYVETRRRETGGSDHLQVGWLLPGQTGTAPSEIVPGWALSPYVPPAAAAEDGTLYAATLTPQNGATTLGSGSAILWVNSAKTAAELAFTFSNLTGPITSQHIHDARAVPGPATAIVFDIDTEEPDNQGVRHWTFAPTGNHTNQDLIDAIESGQAYINLHTNIYPNGEIKGFFQPVSGSQNFVPPPAPPAAELALPGDPVLRKREIVRFLQQATFGAAPDRDGVQGTPSGDPYLGWQPDSIEAVDALGYTAWIDAQLAMDPGADPETMTTQIVPPTTVYQLPSSARRTPNTAVTVYNGAGPAMTFLKEHTSEYPQSGPEPNGALLENAEDIWRTWWKLSCTSPDQLRHRVAFALSQILVVSEDGELDERTRAVLQYYDVLRYHAFGNFRTLLERITLNPAMGRYLDMYGNRKPDPVSGRIPNENYAREILQLFSLGLKRLHPDGTAVLSSSGLPLVTYDQPNVVGFAHTFTGWSSRGTGGGNNYVTPMSPAASDHDTGEKLLLERTYLAANASPTTQTCNDNLKNALDVIFHHPNVGPFICRQLIQRMVTANPSPAYIYRVARVFNDNGAGIRGDLGAVVKTLLLDPEARNQAPRANPGFGHLKEPLLRATQYLRAFRCFSHAETSYSTNNDLGVAVYSPTNNIDLTQPLPTESVDYTNPTATVVYSYIYETLDPDGAAGATFGPTQYKLVMAPGNLLLLRRQTTGSMATDANGNTNSPENGIYVFTANGQPLTRWTGADEPAELNDAYLMVATSRRDAPDMPGGTAGTNGGSLSGNRWFRQSLPVTAVGTSPIQWSLDSTGSRLRYRWQMGGTGSDSFQQTPLKSPTVFNFFEPDYVFLGDTGNAGLYGPEFQITSETSVVKTANWFEILTRRNTNTAATETYGQGFSHGSTIGREIKLDVADQAAIADNTDALVDNLADLLMPGQMPSRLRTLLSSYLASIPLTGSTVLVPSGATWKYFTDATGLGASNIVEGHASWSTANWKHADFVDAGWPGGAAPLGYKTGTTPVNSGIATVLGYGSNANAKWITSYYRTEFTLASAAAAPSITLRLKRDDGAIVYLNGQEVYRNNINAGVVATGTTVANTSGDDGANFVVASVPATFLRDGRNVVAVEVHQVSGGSSDMVFDLEVSIPTLAAGDRMTRIAEALYLISLSPEFATQK